MTPSPIAITAQPRRAPTAAQLRDLAESGMSRKAMADTFGFTRSYVNHLLIKHGITTSAPSGGKPIPGPLLVNGFGEKPTKLMPSDKAVRLASVWSLAGGVGHASSFEHRQPVIQAVSPF